MYILVKLWAVVITNPIVLLMGLGDSTFEIKK